VAQDVSERNFEPDERPDHVSACRTCGATQSLHCLYPDGSAEGCLLPAPLPDGFSDFPDFLEDPDDRASDGFATWLDALEGAPNEDKLFEVLASQRPPTSKLARQQIRGRLVTILARKFKELKSGAAAARTADAWLKEGEDGGVLQGQGFVIEEIEPWGSSVVGADVLDEVEAIIDAYVHTSVANRAAITLWIAYSHIFDCFGVSPILDLSSPTKRCGKSTAVVLCRYLCRAALLSGNITPAALFRAVEAWKPTLLVDEADTFAKMNDELRGILNAGHTRDTAFVVRAEGDANEPRLFSTWAPKLVAAIGRLPDTVEDRAIRVVLTRKPVYLEKRDAFDSEAVRRDCEQTRRQLARFVLDDPDAIALAEVERPDSLNDRAWNNWRPLFAVATAAGGSWPARALAAALDLSGDGEDAEEKDVGTLVLQHVWEVLEPAGKLATGDILKHLVSKDEGPWAKWWEGHLAKDELKSPAARLAKLLRPFGIKPEQLWIEGNNVRGYDAEAFRADTVAVYLQKEARDASDARPGSRSQAGSSVPNDPSDSSEGASAYESNGPPLPGDTGIDDELLGWLGTAPIDDLIAYFEEPPVVEA
jgi:Protein of unknown function (DUF3631)